MQMKTERRPERCTRQYNKRIDQPWEVQRFIGAELDIFHKLTMRRQEYIRSRIAELTGDNALEGRALFDLLVGGKSVAGVYESTRVAVERIYELKKQFYEGYQLP